MNASINQMDIQEVLNQKSRRRELLSIILPFLGLILITLIFIFLTKGALIKGSNIAVLLTQAFTVSIVGVGAAFVFGHGGIDFSIGASSGLAQYVIVAIITKLGLPMYVAILGAVLVGVLNSTLVGALAAWIRVHPFVTSLCMRAICTGILASSVNAAVGGQVRLDYLKYIGFNNVFLKLGVLIVVYAVGYFLFEKSALGKSDKAIGGNYIASFQAGIKVDKVRITAYSLLGLCVGIASVFQLTRAGGIVVASSGSGLEFDVMIALILGGFPLSGGSAAKLRAIIIGAFTITILSNGLILWGLDLNFVNAIKGLLFLFIIVISYDRSRIKQVNMLPV